ncbi:efflux pump antibiotic resistance protein [Rutstroemia sp. NJR-2017a BBW]|nr:efflux pump antibiotic resistance protein [Rutstroemia sp. NJR-2017a BBW]
MHSHIQQIGLLCSTALEEVRLDMNIIGVAIPKIITQFNSLDDVAWYGSAYLLAITAFQPLFGNLYKYFNAKPGSITTNLLALVGSIVCAVATKSSVLIFGRAFLGLGAAGLLQGALAIIGYSVRLDKVPLYQGIVVSALGVSVCIGPVLGGVLTDHVTWLFSRLGTLASHNLTFNSNVPIGAVVLLCILCFVTIKPSSNKVNRALSIRENLQHMDAVGTVLFLGCITSLLLALQWAGQTISWRDSRIIGLFIGFELLAILFGCLQIRLGDYATIPVRVLTKRSIYMGALVLFSLGMSSLTYAYYLPIYFQSIQGDSATRSGVRFIALVLPQIVGLVVVGAIVSKWGYYVPYIIAGITVTSIGAGLLTRIDANTRTIEWAAFMVINGLGIGMAQQLPYTALQAVLEPIDVATGNGSATPFLTLVSFNSQFSIAIAVFSYQLGGRPVDSSAFDSLYRSWYNYLVSKTLQS